MTLGNGASVFERRLVLMLKNFNMVLHVLLAIALVIASLMVVWEFSVQVIHSIDQGDLAHGFLQALGTLFIVWTLSSLISAEIEYVQTSRFHLRVFIEVAMITLLRQLIVDPVKVVAGATNLDDTFSMWHYVLLLSAVLVIGIVHRLVGDSSTRGVAEPVATEPQSHPKMVRELV
ncbi:MAG: phosphate-starvation-inducible PsiE family protein [Rhodospirillales bacterium]|nr:phosphate-starvation-inducible PsiE family protein [Rhodospirillales bacterium]